MDIGKGMCYGQYCEVCRLGNSQTCTPEANTILYVNLKNPNRGTWVAQWVKPLPSAQVMVSGSWD